MKAQDYIKKVRKEITCPSGLVVEIRKIRALDYLKLGMLPDTLNQLKKDPEKVDPTILENVQKMFLTKAVLPQEEFVIVDKPSNELAGNEISYMDIEEADVNFIMMEVTTFSFKNVDGEDLRDFREEPVSSTS